MRDFRQMNEKSQTILKTDVGCVEERNASSRIEERNTSPYLLKVQTFKIPLLTLLLAAMAAPGQSTPTNALTSTISATIEMGQMGRPDTREFQIARRRVRRRPGDDTSPSRGVTDPNLPYLISPRNTFIRNSQPLLRWNPIPGATQYRVEVKALGNSETWTVEVRGTQVRYAGNPFQPGYRYQVTVTAENGISTQGRDNAGFTVLSDDKAQQVEAELAQLQGQPLTEETVFEWVDIYNQYGLYVDAIEMLEERVRSGKGTLDVYGALGDLYRWVGLDAWAIERYERALEQAAENPSEEAGLQEVLGDVNYASGELAKALPWYEAALENYRTSGETERVREVQQKIDDLKPRLP